MNDILKIGATHLGRGAYIYLRQSTPAQVEHNRESTQRQYALAAKATTLGWPSQQVNVVDDDFGLSGSGTVERNGFADSPPKWPSAMSASCSASKSPASPVTMPTGTAYSIFAAAHCLIGQIGLVSVRLANMLLSGDWVPHGNSGVGVRLPWNHVDPNHSAPFETALSRYPTLPRSSVMFKNTSIF